LEVVVRGGAPSFQWYRGNVLLAGETGSKLIRTAVTTAEAGIYRVTVQNTLGSATSRAAKVEIYPAPGITVQPLSRIVNEGQTTSLHVAATGSALTYQWLRGGQPVSGATGRTLSFAGVTALDAGIYSVGRSRQWRGKRDQQPGASLRNRTACRARADAPGGVHWTAIHRAAYRIEWTHVLLGQRLTLGIDGSGGTPGDQRSPRVQRAVSDPDQSR